MHKAAGEDVFYEMEEALIKRILPHSIEAEQSVIGSMILDRDAILVASEILTSDDFYQSQYGIIFDAMVELCNEGKPVDLITLQNRLKEKELPPDISSMEYVRDLISAVPTSANVKYYANIVSEKAILRRLIKVNEEVENACYMEKEGTQMILEEAEKKLFNVLQRRSSDEFVPIQQVVLNAVNNIEKASKMKGTVTGIPTGFVDLDYKTSGMHASDLVLIAAGFLGSQKYVTDAFKVATTARTNVETKPEAYETSVPRVFTAGDMHRGQSLVVWAIREGREAAKAVDESLMGYSYL